MTSFTLFETFFFLTLAITFILILLIIYHFKKRLSTLEERSDKLFSIIQCMAEDLPKVPQPSHIFDNQMSSYPITENEIHTINLEEIDIDKYINVCNYILFILSYNNAFENNNLIE